VVLDYSYGTTSFVMPSVLAKLGTEVLALNPYASTSQAAAFDATEHAAHVARLVVASGAHLGAVLDPDGERLNLVDDSGHVLSNDEALLAILTMIMGRTPDAVVALPVAVSRVAERLVEAPRADGAVLASGDVHTTAWAARASCSATSRD